MAYSDAPPTGERYQPRPAPSPVPGGLRVGVNPRGMIGAPRMGAPGGIAGRGAAGGGVGGAGGAGGGAPPGTMTTTVGPSPEAQAAIKAWQDRQKALAAQAGTPDPNQQFLIDQYKSRLSNDPTQRAIDQAGSAIRDQMAGLQAGGEAGAAAAGRDAGFGGGALAESGQRAMAGQSANITAQRQRDVDALVMGGQGIMGAPGQRQLSYAQLQNQLQGMSPYMGAAQLSLGQGHLGLQQWIAQQEATRAAQQPNMEMIRMLMNSGGY